MNHSDLFGQMLPFGLPTDHEPVAPAGFSVHRIVLAKGSAVTEERKLFVSRICGLYPAADVEEKLDTPHNRIECRNADPLARSREGKTTLVFGEHRSAVRFSEEAGNTCPNYWHFSPYGNCFYECKYCYLAGTSGVWHSPSIKIFLNIEDMLRGIDGAAAVCAKPTSFYLGKLQDGLALDCLTTYTTVFIPFFARHKYARQVILTKSDQIDRLLPLEHGGHSILSWSVNPPDVIERFEENTPSMGARLAAMRKCADAGYPIRAVLMPVIPVAGFEDIYASFIQTLLGTVELKRLTIGGICMYRNARSLMERRCGEKNVISCAMEEGQSRSDGRYRYPSDLRARFYTHIICQAKACQPHLEVSLCLEETQVWKSVGSECGLGRCNCVL
ncbi:MAG: spore photoproduct lyase family protein [bacterium]